MQNSTITNGMPEVPVNSRKRPTNPSSLRAGRRRIVVS